ncbi:MAG: hypothetical protein NT069_07025 [Planctomycetota bacterium]|nr:hypothetical protein [Planctomycetota bacterium]
MPDAAEWNPGELRIICTHCRSRLVQRAEPDWLGHVMSGEGMEATPVRPAGAVAAVPSAGLVCQNGECRRVYLVWDGIPNLLTQEAGVLVLSRG